MIIAVSCRSMSNVYKQMPATYICNYLVVVQNSTSTSGPVVMHACFHGQTLLDPWHAYLTQWHLYLYMCLTVVGKWVGKLSTQLEPCMCCANYLDFCFKFASSSLFKQSLCNFCSVILSPNYPTTDDLVIYQKHQIFHFPHNCSCCNNT